MYKKKNTTAAAAAAAAAAHAADAQAIADIATTRVNQPINMSIPAPKVELDFKISLQDVVNVAISEQSDTLSLARETRERSLEEARRAHEKAQHSLSKLAQKLVDETAIDQSVRAIVTGLTDFTGTQHAAKLVNINASTYSPYAYGRKENDDNPDVDLNKLAIIGEIRIVKKNDHDIVASKRVEIPFTPAMKDAVLAIETTAETVRSAEAALLEVKRKIADLPRMAQRASAELTKAYLRGQLTDTGTLLETVLRTETKSLPNMITMPGVSVVMTVATTVNGDDE